MMMSKLPHIQSDRPVRVAYRVACTRPSKYRDLVWNTVIASVVCTARSKMKKEAEGGKDQKGLRFADAG